MELNKLGRRILAILIAILFIFVVHHARAGDPETPQARKFHLHFHVQRRDTSYTENLEGGDYDFWGECMEAGDRLQDKLISSGNYYGVEYLCEFK